VRAGLQPAEGVAPAEASSSFRRHLPPQRGRHRDDAAGTPIRSAHPSRTAGAGVVDAESAVDTQELVADSWTTGAANLRRPTSTVVD
jgi:hypothetical protein